MMKWTCLTLAIALLAASAAADDPPAPRRVTLKFGPNELEPFNPQRWLFSPEVVADRDGTVRLARSVLLADEVGSTDYRQVEQLGSRLWARKDFGLDSYYQGEKNTVSKAQLFVYGDPKEIEFNGKTLEANKHPSTGWTRAAVEPSYLKNSYVSDLVIRNGLYQALNEVILKGGGTILFEPRQGQSRSGKSLDAGKDWSSDMLGRSESGGEYLVRLRLGVPARTGHALSPVFDLWQSERASLATPGQVKFRLDPAHRFAADAKGGVILDVRTGSTLVPDSDHWSAWYAWANEPKTNHRWAQLRLSFSRMVHFEIPESPRNFKLDCDCSPDPLPAEAKIFITRAATDHPPRLTSVPFIYEKPSPRLKLLREQYQLDKVIAPGKTEMEQLMLLRHWVRNQWHTAWGTHPASWMPPWDTLQILACKDQPDCLTMCTHYACVFTQCCLALGWNARHCILDHHCVSEVWVDQHQKWVMMDAGNSKERPDCNLHFERNGVPLSALELHLAHRDKKTAGIMVVFTPKALMEAVTPLCRKPPVADASTPPGANAPGSPRPETVPVSELKKFPVCGLENYRRYAFPGRNNYLTSLYPGELYQGWAEYFYDGYWWVGDERDDPQLSPEYSKHLPPSRPQDIDWDLNWTRIHLCRTAKAGELQVDLETLTPNLEHLEIADAGGSAWKRTPTAFTWKLQAGKNVLKARGVNAWGRAGKPAEVTVEWQPAN
jgi:hypothetical protein